jgi:hypothetical protein
VISFRYHIVSVVSVFLALAIGVALGGGPLKGEVDNTLIDQVKADRQAKSELQAEISGLKSGNGFVDSFAQNVAPGLIADALRGRVVTLLVLPTAQAEDVNGLSQLVAAAGGTVGGTLRVGDGLIDVANKQLVDELGSQLQDGASDVAVPADASAYERMAALVARAIGTDKAGGASVDATAKSIMAGLSTAGLMSPDGELNRRGDLVLVVAGPGQGTVEQRQGTNTITTTLVKGIDADTAGTVVAGPVASARAGGLVKAVRDDVVAARDVSTVDSLSRTAAQVVTVMALAQQSHGESGQYGAIDAADGAMPGAGSSE